MKPTDEQLHATELALKPDNLKIEAFAGAGKTSTLKLIAESKPRERGLYLAFGRDIKDEAGAKFPRSVACKTAHGLAFGPVGKHYADRLRGRITPRMLADRYSLKAVERTTARGIAAYALRAVNQFCQSGDSEISVSHLMDAAAVPHLKDVVVATAQRLWCDMDNLSGDLPVTHDFYLKKWALSNPVLPADYILFDEAQDANGVMLSIVGRQSSQKIFVGDRYQQIYGWRGAVNAMQELHTENSCKLTQSFRFGPAIADAANAVLNTYLNAGVNLKGFDQLDSRLGEVARPDAYLFRTNGALIHELVCLLESDEPPCVAVVRGTKDLIMLIEGAEELYRGGRSYLPELASFETWQDLREYADSEVGGDMAPLVRLMERPLTEIKRALEKVAYVKESDAEVVLSTAHKSKGREWPTVKLANDFQYPQTDDEGNEAPFNPEEANLLYVAVTRAQNTLDITECEAFRAVNTGFTAFPAPKEDQLTTAQRQKRFRENQAALGRARCELYMTPEERTAVKIFLQQMRG